MIPYKGKTPVQRFHTSKWNALTRAIHDLSPGGALECPADKWNTVHGTVNRFNDAYDGERCWKHSGRGNGVITVTRTI